MGGLWPLVHLCSFEWVFGPKTDKWLQMTTGGLLAGAGLTQLAAAADPEGPRHARRLGLVTAVTLLAVDLMYVPKRRLRPTYLLDAAMEAAWSAARLRGAIRHEHLRLGQRPVGDRGPTGEGFCFDETFIHRMRREPEAGPTVTIHAYSPPLERAGQYGEQEDGLLHRVSTSSEEHLSPKSRQGTPSTASRRQAEVNAREGGAGSPGREHA
ncbi:hypothetical protein ACF058_28735 [Streptomyces sp. NPDC015501]|uniref:hypothetical protein n=1 Tax=unclassified Streptomyces TaxID=2593676 RepID=UPI0036FCF919